LKRGKKFETKSHQNLSFNQSLAQTKGLLGFGKLLSVFDLELKIFRKSSFSTLDLNKIKEMKA